MCICGILLSRFCDVYDIVKRENRKALRRAHKTGKLHFTKYECGFCARTVQKKSINVDKIDFSWDADEATAFKYWYGSTNADPNMNSLPQV